MTYSIVARCPETGDLGVAAQTCNFAVGSWVPWIRAGVGVVATQALVNVSYGPRQCVRYASHVELEGAVVLGNLMRDSEVVEAMAQSWETTRGQPLHERLIAALHNAQDAGGDIRGQQSAAIKVAGPHVGEWWEHISIDLRVDDHPNPLTELSRLLHISTAYRDADKAGTLEEQGDRSAALALWNRARAALPESPHLPFWHGVFLIEAGRIEEAKEALAYRRNKDFPELLARLFQAGQLKTDPETLRSLLEIVSSE